MVIQQHQSVSTDSLVKPSMSRTLVYRTNKEFDKCAELLRNIITVQGKINKKRIFFFSWRRILFIYNKESRRNSKSSIIGEINRKSQPSQQQSQVNIRQKKSNTKPTVTKASFIKTSMSLIYYKSNSIGFLDINSGTEIKERRSSYSPTKSLLPSTGAAVEVCFIRKIDEYHQLKKDFIF